jgi:Cys-tRNA(Pro) deacylase
MSSDKIQKILNHSGISFHIKEFPESTRTSLDAAKAIGCDVSQIAKSILFEGIKTEKPILVIASGSNRIDEDKVELEIGEKIKKADAEFVKNKTGYSIGGVPPIGHNEKILTLIDEDLTKQNKIWAAAGTPHSVFELTPKQLLQITEGKVISIKVSSKNL